MFTEAKDGGGGEWRQLPPSLYLTCVCITLTKCRHAFRQSKLLQFVGQRVSVDTELGSVAEYERDDSN